MRRLFLFTLAAGLAGTFPLLGQSARGELFPEPFLVEHRLVRDFGDGQQLAFEPVTDFYGGNRIVSVRSQGSRVIVDLVERQVTEIDPAKGTYWSLSFDRLADLQQRMHDVHFGLVLPEGIETDEAAEATLASSKARSVAQRSEASDFDVVESGQAQSALAPGVARSSSSAPSLRRFAVRQNAERIEQGAAAAEVEVWIDPRLSLSAAALEALEVFEDHVAGGRLARSQGDLGPAEYVGAARRRAGGALAVRVRRPFDLATGQGSVEDVAERVERLESVPVELALIPSGLRRVPHPLEQAIAGEELDRRLSQGRRP